MKTKLQGLIFLVLLSLMAACVKETYDMNKLSTEVHLKPSMVLTAIRGEIALSDMVKSNDTVVFDQNKFVKIIFKEEDVIDLNFADFSPFKGKGPMNATIDPQTIDLGIDELLDHLTGTFLISDPSITLSYTNSFRDPIQVTFNASGKRNTQTVNLNLAPFTIAYPGPGVTEVTSSLKIDKSNSALPALISLPPETITFSGSASINSSGTLPLPGDARFLASLEIVIPMELRFNNLQFADTVDNFMKDDSGDSAFDFGNFGLLRVDLNASNGFPLGIAIKMSLYDSVTRSIKATVDATDLLKPAPVDNTGKSNGVTDSKTGIELTPDFFKSVNKADKIIFSFALNTTDNGTKDVKIYSDYSIDFNAALIVKPDINLK